MEKPGRLKDFLSVAVKSLLMLGAGSEGSFFHPSDRVCDLWS